MSAFRIMTWNVENLFPAKNSADQAYYTEKLSFLASVIIKNAPDIIALQEIGDDGALHDLQAEILRMGVEYEYACSGVPGNRGIRVAFLSRLRLENKKDIVDFPSGPATMVKELDADGHVVDVRRMSRGALKVDVKIATATITMITLHLKSKLLTFPRANNTSVSNPKNEFERSQGAGIALMKRTAEAITVRDAASEILSQDPSAPVIVLGDMNDVPDAQTSLILIGPPGSEIGSRGFDTPDKGDSQRLWNLAPCICPEIRYSRIEHGRKELLDQIFVSEALLPMRSGKRMTPQVISLVDLEPGGPANVENDPGERKKSIVPDHAPVLAEFEI